MFFENFLELIQRFPQNFSESQLFTEFQEKILNDASSEK